MPSPETIAQSTANTGFLNWSATFDRVDGPPSVAATPLLAYSLLTLVQSCASFGTKVFDYWTAMQKLAVLFACSSVLAALPNNSACTTNATMNGDANEVYSDDEDADIVPMDTSHSATPGSTAYLLQGCVKMLEDGKMRDMLLSAALEPPSSDATLALARVCYFVRLRTPKHSQSFLICNLSFRSDFIRRLWLLVNHCSCQQLTFGSKIPGKPLVLSLKQGLPLNVEEKTRLLPLLSLFCVLFGNVVQTLDDHELCSREGLNSRSSVSMSPFSMSQLQDATQILRDIALGLIDLAYPDSRSPFTQTKSSATTATTNDDAAEWSSLLDSLVELLQLLHARDSRMRFMRDGFWSNHGRKVLINWQVYKYQARSSLSRQRQRPFTFVRWLTHDELAAEQGEGFGPMPTAGDLRNLAIMRRIPFVVRFLERVQIFQELVVQDREDSRGQGFAGQHEHDIHIRIRRNYLYEDALDALSKNSAGAEFISLFSAHSLKPRIRVQMINWAGLSEAGIDGGGIFREFLSELLKTAFDPQRGFFITTPHEGLLYPNPTAIKLFPDTYDRHYFFLGRILGKLIYEGQMADLHFASFFLSKLLRKSNENVDIHHLKSMDPELYRNLIYLKEYKGDATNLELDFSVIADHLGDVETIDLKPMGSTIQVNNSNKLEYITAMANYYLNERLRPMTRAMRAGLADVVTLDWLGMFDHDELQTLISGTDSDISVEDMRGHSMVNNMAAESDLAILELFWKVVDSFDPATKRKLLKFITGCSRPPLMGFKDLDPPLGIQLVPDEDRLPTAATCMNLLKLPRFKDEQRMRNKLLYAIEAGEGFELS